MLRLPPLLVVVLAAAAIGACSLAVSVDGLAGPALVTEEAGSSPVVDAAGEDDGRRDAADASSGGYRAAVLADTPLAYYRLDDTTGNVVKDELGAHDGEVRGGTLGRVAGALGGDGDHAAVFDGASFVLVGDVFPFAGTASYTFEAWAQPLAANSDPMCMIAKNIPDDAGALRDGYGFFLADGTGRILQNRYRGGAEEVAVGPAIATGTFTHLVATFDGALIRLYVDGEKVAEKTSSKALPTVANPLTLGASRGGIYCFFRGALDEIAIYGSVLAPDRIRAHHAAGVGQ